MTREPQRYPFPLEGIRVLDLSRAMSGPYVGRLCSDLGAEVVKVEVPGIDITQVFGPRSLGHSGLYVQQNAGKRNVSIDLSAPGGADSVTALHGMVAVQAALRLRDRTGCGQHIDLGMFEAMLATDDYIHYSLEDTLPVWSARGQVFDAAGGPILVSADPKLLWARLRARAGLRDPDPEATGEPKFAARRRLITRWVTGFGDRAELICQLEAAGLAWAEVRTPETVLQSTAIAREVAAQVDDRHGGTRPVIRAPYRFSAGSCEPRGGAAYVGEHNHEVLGAWLGLADSEVDELSGAGVLREAAPDDG